MANIEKGRGMLRVNRVPQVLERSQKAKILGFMWSMFFSP